MKKVICILMAVSAILASCQQQRHLTLLHLNDTHSHFEPVRGGAEDGLGGIIERAAYIDSVRKADGPENVLLLHAGDFSQGSTYFSELGGDLEIECLNKLGYDVVTLGNHEFDNGLEDLGRRLASLNMPVVCCNFDFSPFEAGKYITPYAIVEKAGAKIGVVGVVCPLKELVAGETADRLPEFDLYSTTQKWADYLKNEEKCDLVIALTHLGFTEHNPGAITDLMMCAATRNIDLIVGGHSHTFLEKMEYGKNLDGKDIPIVTDGCWGEYIGQLDIVL